jgi:hypothetical protein
VEKVCGVDALCSRPPWDGWDSHAAVTTDAAGSFPNNLLKELTEGILSHNDAGGSAQTHRHPGGLSFAKVAVEGTVLELRICAELIFAVSIVTFVRDPSTPLRPLFRFHSAQNDS